MLNEFGWSTEESDGYQGGEALDVKVGITPEGRYEIRNHDNTSESQSFETPEELGSALASVLADKARSIS